MRQRYDDFADWYDAYATRGIGLPFALAADRLLARLLGAGYGRLCLDLGCGGGAHAPALTGLDWQLIGVDISAPQIGLARRKGLLRWLPAPNGSHSVTRPSTPPP